MPICVTYGQNVMWNNNLQLSKICFCLKKVPRLVFFFAVELLANNRTVESQQTTSFFDVENFDKTFVKFFFK
jgi:hypothetical protein